MFGPLFRWELIRLARRPTLWRLRVGLVLAGFLTLCWTYLKVFSFEEALDWLIAPYEIPQDQLTELGQRFSMAFLVVQLAAVLIVTPVFAATGMIEELEAHRSDFLLTTPLSPREIVLGKYLARGLSLLSVIAASWPVVMLTAFIGGVDPREIVAGTLVAGMALFALAAQAMGLVLRGHSLLKTLQKLGLRLLILTLFTLPNCCCGTAVLAPLSPISTLLAVHEEGRNAADLEQVWVRIGWFFLAQGAWSFWELYRGIRRYRSAVRNHPEHPRSAMATTMTPLPVGPQADEHELALPLRVALRAYRIPPMGDDEDPLLWKLEQFSPSSRSTLESLNSTQNPLWLLALGLLSISFFTVLWDWGNLETLKVLTGTLAVILPVLATLHTFVQGLKVVGHLGQERQRGTLVGLFTLPIDREDILRASWKFGRGTWTLPLIWVSIAFFGQAVGAIHPAAVVGMTLLWMGGHLFAVNLALACSVICQTSLRATLAYLLVLLSWIAVPILLEMLRQSTPDWTQMWLTTAMECLSLPYGLFEGCFSTFELAQFPGKPRGSWVLRSTAPAAAGLVAAILGLGLWRLAVSQFQRE
jgi:ABC-type transport system involved in multi-copper enzyme maturation permease subunit